MPAVGAMGNVGAAFIHHDLDGKGYVWLELHRFFDGAVQVTKNLGRFVELFADAVARVFFDRAVATSIDDFFHGLANVADVMVWRGHRDRFAQGVAAGGEEMIVVLPYESRVSSVQVPALPGEADVDGDQIASLQDAVFWSTVDNLFVNHQAGSKAVVVDQGKVGNGAKLIDELLGSVFNLH